MNFCEFLLFHRFILSMNSIVEESQHLLYICFGNEAIREQWVKF